MIVSYSPGGAISCGLRFQTESVITYASDCITLTSGHGACTLP